MLENSVSVDGMKGYCRGLPVEFRRKLCRNLKKRVYFWLKCLLVCILAVVCFISLCFLRDYFVIGGLSEIRYILLFIVSLISIVILLNIVYNVKKNIRLYRLARRGCVEWLDCRIKYRKGNKVKVYNMYGEVGKEYVIMDEGLYRKGKYSGSLLLVRIINSHYGEIYYRVLER